MWTQERLCSSERHCRMYFQHGRLGDPACATLTISENLLHCIPSLLKIRPAFTQRRGRLRDPVGASFLAVDASEGSAFTTRPDLRQLARIELLMVREHQAYVGPTGVIATYLQRVRYGSAHSGPYFVRSIGKQDRIPERFAHFLAVEARQPRKF